jgi:arabinose-5-phosphate isomerase
MRSAVPRKLGSFDQDGVLERCRQVIKIELAGLEKLAATIDETLLIAAERLLNIRGRVVVSGVGKSGHIAGKIAATLASTGTPALFVHPTEASHGDLGMITVDDAILALSNSGETPELSDLVRDSRRRGILLIAVTQNKASALAKAADLVLQLPNVPEACPFNLAPTTSTVMMLALGDALAIALLEARKFTPENFSNLHPGGQLGQKLTTVSHLMHVGDEVPLIDIDTDLTVAIVRMTEKRFGCTGVVNHAGDLVGIITDGDLRRHLSADMLKAKVTEVMTEAPQTVAPDRLAVEALGLMNAKKISSLMVVKDRKPVGILHIHDCLRAGLS